MTDTMRVFMAFLPSETTKGEWQDLQRQIASQRENVWRWIKAEHLHLTLFFWADMSTDALPVLMSTLQSASLPKGLGLNLTHIQGFPSPQNCRVLALTGSPSKALKQFHQQLSQTLIEQDLLGVQKPFRPHITLGRRRKPDSYPPHPVSMTMGLNHLAFIQSTLTAQGPEYKILAELKTDLQT